MDDRRTDYEYSPATLAAQALGEIDPQTGSLVHPIYPATTFERDKDLSYATYGRVYGRPNNPTVEPAERLMSALDQGTAALLFGSGMAAASAALLALPQGAHIVASRTMYWSMRAWFDSYAGHCNFDLTLIDDLSTERLAQALRPGLTQLVWMESPVNPTWEVLDIARAAEFVHRAGARLIIDSSAATPVLTRPLTLGADLVMYSATKFLNGHSDVVAGCLVTAREDEYWHRIKEARRLMGGILGPFEAWLLLRSLRTLYIRVRHQSRSALSIARHFENHPRLERVLYSGLESHPQHEIARRQMEGGFGGMLSVLVKGGIEAATAVAARTRLFKRATSFGGTESLIEHRASIEGLGTPVPDTLLRLSVGLEEVEELIADLNQALDSSA
ncbi:MAG TPA: PLP-dependent transferase [Dongiaceae bacterium]|jgi:cystathionine gamma-synthase|nr:PLP-dependent transferase [Dongiaceae bacterium]